LAVSLNPVRLVDLREDDLPKTGASEEFDLDDYIEEQDASTQTSIGEARPWVANALYPVETLASLRLRAGFSQAEFASKCGMRQPHVSRYESGRVEPGIFQAKAMAEVLGVSLDDLVKALQNAANRK
jgi:DNA-binding XRE family transcriptional regulator